MPSPMCYCREVIDAFDMLAFLAAVERAADRLAAKSSLWAGEASMKPCCWIFCSLW